MPRPLQQKFGLSLLPSNKVTVMSILTDIKKKKTPMRRKLFFYMLALAVILLIFLAVGLFFLGHFSTTKAKVSEDLSFQLDVYERQIDKHYEDFAMMGITLSHDTSENVERYLSANSISFKDLNDSPEHINGVQSAIFDTLLEELLKTDCSGAFIILNATVNSSIENADLSKTGLYFQRGTLDETDETVLLFRGIAELGKANDILPHRKWRLEFKTDLIPSYNEYVSEASLPLEKSCFITDVLTLPGTSERAMHFMVPIIGSDGTVYGLCGFEICENYFKTHYAQPTQLTHLTCMLTSKQEGIIVPSTGFSAGVLGGYYLPPQGDLTIEDIGNGLVNLNGSSSYVGMTKNISLCSQGEYVLTVMIPKAEYDEMVASNIISLLLLVFLLIFATVASCIIFSRRFVSPLLKGLEQIRKQEHREATSTFVEIDDLFVYLAEQDRLNDEEKEALRRERDKNANALESQKAEIDRLAYSRKSEIDPDDYEAFKMGIKSLTKTERIIFELYMSGKTAKEIMDKLGIQESTLKYHNHNILGKLNVSSRKQMLRYATLLKQENGDL